MALNTLGEMALPIGLVSGEALQFVFWLMLLWRKGIQPIPNLNRPNFAQGLDAMCSGFWVAKP